jgi:hypothetical protein
VSVARVPAVSKRGGGRGSGVGRRESRVSSRGAGGAGAMGSLVEGARGSIVACGLG